MADTETTGNQKLKLKMVLTPKRCSTLRRKLFEIFSKTIYWKVIQKFYVINNCGLHFGRTSQINTLYFFALVTPFKNDQTKLIIKLNNII